MSLFRSNFVHFGTKPTVLYCLLLCIVIVTATAPDEHSCAHIHQMKPLLMGILKNRFVAIGFMDQEQDVHYCLYDMPPNAFDSAANRLYLSNGTILPNELFSTVYSKGPSAQFGVTVQDSLGGGLYFNVNGAFGSTALVYNLDGKQVTTLDSSASIPGNFRRGNGSMAFSTTEQMKIYSNVLYEQNRPTLNSYTFNGQVLSGISSANSVFPPLQTYYLCPVGDDANVYVTNGSCTVSDWGLTCGFTDQKSFYGFTDKDVYIFAHSAVTTELGKPVKYTRIALDEFIVLGQPPPVPPPSNLTTATGVTTVPTIPSSLGTTKSSSVLIPVLIAIVAIVALVILAIGVYCFFFSKPKGTKKPTSGAGGGGDSSFASPKDSAKSKNKKSKASPYKRSSLPKSKKAASKGPVASSRRTAEGKPIQSAKKKTGKKLSSSMQKRASSSKVDGNNLSTQFASNRGKAPSMAQTMRTSL